MILGADVLGLALFDQLRVEDLRLLLLGVFGHLAACRGTGAPWQRPASPMSSANLTRPSALQPPRVPVVHREEHADLAAHVHVAVHAAVAVDGETLPAAHGDVLPETADERLAVVLDAAAAAGEWLRREVRAVFGLVGRFQHLLHERAEVVVARGEVGLDVDLDHHAVACRRRRRARRLALGGHGAGALRALGQTLLEDDLDRLVHVAFGLHEGAATIVETGLSAVPKLLDLLHADLAMSSSFFA